MVTPALDENRAYEYVWTDSAPATVCFLLHPDDRDNPQRGRRCLGLRGHFTAHGWTPIETVEARQEPVS